MEDKQKKQVEIIREVLNSEDNLRARAHLLEARLALRDCAKELTQGLNVLDVISGHSDIVMAASAIVGLAQQIDLLYEN